MKKNNTKEIKKVNRPDASFPTSVGKNMLPNDYASILKELKERIQSERLRVTLAANSALVLLYWDIGRIIVERQQQQGWGAKVIDRISFDLKHSFPEMSGFSPRNLKYMRKFAETWPDQTIVQEMLAQIPWYHNLALLEKLDDVDTRLWYAQKTVAEQHNQQSPFPKLKYRRDSNEYEMAGGTRLSDINRHPRKSVSRRMRGKVFPFFVSISE